MKALQEIPRMNTIPQKLGRKAVYISDFNEIANFVKSNALNNDLVLTLGAGTVSNIKNLLVENKDD